MKTLEKPIGKLVNLGREQIDKISKNAEYGDRSAYVRDAIDAYNEKTFAPLEKKFKREGEDMCCRFFKKQTQKIAKYSKPGQRAHFVRCAIDAYSPLRRIDEAKMTL